MNGHPQGHLHLHPQGHFLEVASPSFPEKCSETEHPDLDGHGDNRHCSSSWLRLEFCSSGPYTSETLP